MGLLRELVEVFAEEGPRMLARIDDAIRHGIALGSGKSQSQNQRFSSAVFRQYRRFRGVQGLEEKGKCGVVAGAEPTIAPTEAGN